MVALCLLGHGVRVGHLQLVQGLQQEALACCIIITQVKKMHMPDDDDGARGGKGRAEGAGLRTQRECSCPFDGSGARRGSPTNLTSARRGLPVSKRHVKKGDEKGK